MHMAERAKAYCGNQQCIVAAKHRPTSEQILELLKQVREALPDILYQVLIAAI